MQRSIGRCGAAAGVILGVLGLLSAPGCGSGSASGEATIELGGLDRSERFVRSRMEESEGAAPERAGSPDRPPLVVDGSPVGWEELRSRLSEASGARVIEEVALERVLRRELRRAGFEIGAEEIERERERVADSFRQAGASERAGEEGRLLLEVRRARGLGPRRFEALLWRNAALRALVRDEVEVSDEDVERMREMVYGPRYRVRLITTETLQEASAALRRLQAGEMFGEVAAEVSTDPSAARGGVIEPISAADPSYPAAIRAALPRLASGETSAPIAIDSGFAILRMEEALAGEAVSFPDVRADLEQRARRAEERLLMQQRAEQLLESAGVTVLDPSLEWSWSRRGP